MRLLQYVYDNLVPRNGTAEKPGMAMLGAERTRKPHDSEAFEVNYVPEHLVTNDKQ